MPTCLADDEIMPLVLRKCHIDAELLLPAGFR